MKILDAVKLLSSKKASIFDLKIPSTEQIFSCSTFNIGQRKKIVRTALFENEEYDTDYQLTKLSLIKQCCNEIEIDKITDVDFISILAQMRIINIVKPLQLTLLCNNCEQKSNFVLNFNQIIKNCENYKFKTNNAKIKFDDIEVEFILSDCKAVDHISYKQYIQVLTNMKEFEKVQNAFFYVYPVIFIKQIFINGKEIEDWQNKNLIEKINFIEENFEHLNISEEETLFDKIIKTFPFKRLDSLFPKVICLNCKDEKEGVLTYDNFFIE